MMIRRPDIDLFANNAAITRIVAVSTDWQCCAGSDRTESRQSQMSLSPLLAITFILCGFMKAYFPLLSLFSRLDTNQHGFMMNVFLPDPRPKFAL